MDMEMMSALAANPSLQYGTTTYPIKSTVMAYLVINVICEVLVIGIVILRCVARHIHGTRIGADDYLCIISTILGIGSLVVSLVMAPLGNGYPVTEVMGNLATHLLLTFILQPFYMFSLVFSKLSVCAFYMRIFGQDKMLKLLTKITIVIVIVWGLSHYLAGVFICQPVSAQYDLLAAATGKCLDQIPLFQSLIILNIITDIMIMALPLKTIWTLKMRQSEKLAIMGSFLVGIALVVMGIIRIVYVSTVDIRGDLTGTMPISIFLSVLDPQLAIVCISIPMLRPIWQRWRGTLSGSRTNNTGSNSNSRSGGRSGGNSHLRTIGSTPLKRSKLATDRDLEMTVYDVHAESDERANPGDAPSIASDASEQRLREKDAHRIHVETEYTVETRSDHRS